MLFFKKPPHKHNPLERINIKIDKILTVDSHSKDSDEEYCMLIGETSKYNIYLYVKSKKEIYKSRSSYVKVNGCKFLDSEALHRHYFIRQDKSDGKNVVFLGKAYTHYCIAKNKIYTIFGLSPAHQSKHPLYCIDTESGITEMLYVLSNEQMLVNTGFSSHIHCQDTVDSLSSNGDEVFMEVTRHHNNSFEEDRTEKSHYRLSITEEGGHFCVREFQ